MRTAVHAYRLAEIRKEQTQTSVGRACSGPDCPHSDEIRELTNVAVSVVLP